LIRRQYPPSMYPTSYYHNTMLWQTFPGDNVLMRPSFLYGTAERTLNPQASVFRPSFEEIDRPTSGISPNSFGHSNSASYTPNSWFAFSPNLPPPGPSSDDSSHTECEDILSTTSSLGKDSRTGTGRITKRNNTIFHGHPEVRVYKDYRRVSKVSSGSSQSMRRDVLLRSSLNK